MDANAYEQRVRETARAMGYDARTIDRMFSPEVKATIAANDARADATDRHQEARRLALAHVAQEQAAAMPLLRMNAEIRAIGDIRLFSINMIFGLIFGTYSSNFLAPSLLYWISEAQGKGGKKAK